jgi:hypothetical protein
MPVRLCFLLLFLPLCVPAQHFQFELDTAVKVSQQGKRLYNAWSGGINAGQFSSIHLNHDTIPDLVVFDRTSSKLSTFLAVADKGSYHYQHTPQYERQFPDVRFWMLLADYDRDGRMDIFTHTQLGIRVYRNTTRSGEELSWETVSPALFTKSFNRSVNLQVGASDIPALVDVDADGDLDVLTFDFVGSFVEYHQNQSMETYGRSDSLVFRRVNACWGNFEEGNACGDFAYGLDCQTTGWLNAPASQKNTWVSLNTEAAIADPARIQHAGSTILALDLDGDRDQDILLGDVSCDNLFQLTNEGSRQQADFKNHQAAYPTGHPIEFPTFPAAFYVDLDFDGVKDLLATPNVFINEGGRVNFAESAWFYHNQGSHSIPQFIFKQTDFLQNTMIEVGENAAPAFADFDADGDLDLFVGNAGLPGKTGPVATVALFENTGTATQPAFEWRSNDYLQLSSLKLTQIKPSFADINGDGKLDFCFAGTAGSRCELKYLLNKAPRQKPFRFDVRKTLILPIEIGPGDVPAFSDLDKDGDVDLLIGKASGNLECYQNLGSARKSNFRLETTQCGGLEASTELRNLAVAVADLDGDGKPDLFTGNWQNETRIFPSFTNNMVEFPSLETQVIKNYSTPMPISAKPGNLLLPTAADLDGDGFPEIILGTQAGGLIYLRNTGKPE